MRVCSPIVSLVVTLLGLGTGCAGDPARALPGVADSKRATELNPDRPSSVSAVDRWKSCAKMIHADGGYTGADLQETFDRPVDVQQLLQNLKLAWKRELLLQSSFYEEATLLKFFNGSKVTSGEPYNPLSKDTGYVVAILDSNPIQNLTVRVESRCWFSQSADSRVPSKVYFNAFLKIYGGAVPQMTLNVVRGVFGTETQNTIEDPITPHGYAYTPIDKGSVVYSNKPKENQYGLRIEAGFYFRLDPPQNTETYVPRVILDGDVVQRIEVNDYKERSLR
jgi:hypothetical protein